MSTRPDWQWSPTEPPDWTSGRVPIVCNDSSGNLSERTCVANLIQPTLETGMSSPHKTIKLYFFLPLNDLSLIVFSCLTTADGVFSARPYLLPAGPRPIKRSPAGS